MYANQFERQHEADGWKIYKVVSTKEEAVEIITQLRSQKIQCARFHHVLKILDIDCHIIWINPETLNKPYDPRASRIKKPDPNNRASICCLHCKHWERKDYAQVGTCVLTGVQTACTKRNKKCFEWNEKYL